VSKLKGTKWPGPGFYVALAGVAWLLSACGMFQIRDAVAPSVGGIPERQALNPEDLLFNFESAVSHKGAGLPLYERCLSDDFILVLDQLDADEIGLGINELPKDSDVAAQGIFVTSDNKYLTASSDSIEFKFTSKAPEGGTGSDSTYYQDIPYELTVRRLEGGNWVKLDSLRVAGKIRLSMSRGSDTIWRFRRWIDQRVEEATSLGRVHGELAPLS